jgi:NO-binding membrane sensor protein with MHYT domain/two-component sensor histidine kinase
MEHVSGHYNHYWLVFSILIGILFSYIALDLRWKMFVFKDFMYNLWLLGCSVAMGIGIWTMHFIGMLAMKMPNPIVYDGRIVFLSLLLSIVGTGIAFMLMKKNLFRLLLSSVLMGCGIVGMHYLGVSALHVDYAIKYSPTVIFLSIAIAIAAAFASLWLLFFFQHNQSANIYWRILSSILMGTGISAMHYIGMWGTYFTSISTLSVPPKYLVTLEHLSAFISVPAIVVVLIMILSSAFLDKEHIVHMKELTQNERKLRESEKLSIVGEMAAGVAHEIRNPLTTLLGFTKLIHDNTGDPLNKKYLNIMTDELKRINFIVSEFMVLSKPHIVKITETNLSILIKNVITLLNTQAIMKNVEIIPKIEEESLLLKCEENQIKQVVANIIKNAIEAMPGGGKITVSLEKVDAYIVISVVDTGVGIPEENLHMLGTPFYTTKSEGTGLGLMVSKKIIQNHNGKFKIQSNQERGTTVTISLPIVQKELDKNNKKDLLNEDLSLSQSS